MGVILLIMISLGFIWYAYSDKISWFFHTPEIIVPCNTYFVADNGHKFPMMGPCGNVGSSPFHDLLVKWGVITEPIY